MERKVSCLNARLDKQVLFKERSGNIDQVVRNVTSIPYHKDYE